MLVISRHRDERIVCGDDKTIHINLTDGEWDALRAAVELMKTVTAGVYYPVLQQLTERMNASTGKIVFTIVDIRGDKVRVGVGAPKCVAVDRQEVHDAKVRTADAIASGASAAVVAKSSKVVKKRCVYAPGKGE